MKKYFIPDRFFWRLLFGKEGKRRFRSLVYNSPLVWWMILLIPPRGTRSVLFGVHQFLWHPLTVVYAWRKIYGRWPNLYELIAIAFHDIGYLGKTAMDSSYGQTHPELGARIARRLAYTLARLRGEDDINAWLISEWVWELTLYHSTHYATKCCAPVSKLYLPDKACVLYEPMWFYLLRAWSSGELREYVANDNNKRWRAGLPEQTSREWLVGYRTRIREKVDDHFEAEENHKRRELLRAINAPHNHHVCECDICVEK